MVYSFDNIPSELKRLKQWVCWMGDKLPKNPMTGNNAMSNNPSTWGTFEQAVKSMEHFKFDGIGFMFANGYFGVDLDHCLDNDELIDDFVESLDSYTEYSKSCDGIHIICKGELPVGSRRRGAVEMYQHGRYFIMTGNVFDGEIRPIRDCTDKIKRLHEKYLGKRDRVVSVGSSLVQLINMTDEDLIDKARASSTGTAFQVLYSGQWQGIYSSQSEADLALCNHLAFWTQKDSSQMDRIFRSSGLMRKKWDRLQGGATYGMLTIQKAIDGTAKVYEPNGGVMGGAREYAYDSFRASFDARHSKIYPMNDTGNAGLFCELYEGLLKYSYQNKTWFVWTGKQWLEDLTGEVKKLADKTIEEMQKRANSIESEEQRDKYLKWINKTCSSHSKNAMITESQHIGNMPCLLSDFDSQADLLNCENGIINLRNGELIQHESSYMQSKLCGSAYNVSGSGSPVRWLKFFDEITDGDKELQRYLQKAVGYSLTGSIAEQCMFFCYGNGRNGKSTFLEIISEMMGSYASHTQPETIMLSKGIGGNGATTEIARLKGARFVTTVEPNEGVKMNEGLVKQLTGGDKVTARFLYGKEFEFTPEFKLWLGANHKPIIRGTDLGIWRRIRLIPFTVQIPENRVDKGLKQKLIGELDLILKWAVEGCMMWQKEGLIPPSCVQLATNEYKQEMDSLSVFCDLYIEIDYSDAVKASDLYSLYCKWADENHEYRMSNTKFGKEFIKRYPEKIRKGDGYYYKNIKLTKEGRQLITVGNYGNFYNTRNGA